MSLLRQGSLWLSLFALMGAMVLVWFSLPAWASIPATALFAVLAAYCVVSLVFPGPR